MFLTITAEDTADTVFGEEDEEDEASEGSEATTLGAGFMAGTESGQWHNLSAAAEALSGAPVTPPLGEPGISRQQWSQAVSRSRSWIPELSSLDF